MTPHKETAPKVTAEELEQFLSGDVIGDERTASELKSRQAQAIDRAIVLWEHSPFFLIVRGDAEHVATLKAMRDELRKQLEGMR